MPQTQQTLLFPALLKAMDWNRHMSVLEIGGALPETLGFFSQFKCRLQFAAMYGENVLGVSTSELTEAELIEHFTRCLDIPKGQTFDLCLFWDFFNYIDDKALKAFNAAIMPHLHQSTRAHAFTVRTLETSFANQQYGIDDSHLFRIRPKVGTQAKRYPHTQAILLNMLTGFDIDQGMLLPDGRLEVLMTASNDTGNVAGAGGIRARGQAKLFGR